MRFLRMKTLSLVLKFEGFTRNIMLEVTDQNIAKDFIQKSCPINYSKINKPFFLPQIGQQMQR